MLPVTCFIVERDVRKRRIKPVQRHLLQLDFAGIDSSDDEDFKIPDTKSSDDSCEEEETDDEDGESDDGGNVADDSDDGSSRHSLSGKGSSVIITDHTEMPQETTTNVDIEPRRELKVLLCSVCLGDTSEEDDEIVECDSCGISVHEGCYGISEDTSVASTLSSASTEPWFCDACKAGVTPHCELCPNTGGIFKETDAARWVHIVCALYTPGVAFGDVDKLSPVTLFEMRYEKWGAKECSLCEDARFSHTGVCIGCDAGMCRTFFHVTCAQREGLLSEASPDEDIADPFYAYCRQHANKSSLRTKRRNWLALQSSQRRRDPAPGSAGQGQDADQLRIQRKLNRHRKKYRLARTDVQPWVPPVKMGRMLLSSPNALRRLLRKADLLGVQSHAVPAVVTHKDIRRKWHVAPAFSVEFMSYYLDRGERMLAMRSRRAELTAQRERLHEQERQLRRQYEQLAGTMDHLRETSRRLRQEGERLWRTVNQMAQKECPVPEPFRPKKPLRSPKQHQAALPVAQKSPPAVIHKCTTCLSSRDQHQLAFCDKCKCHYHLACLEPPLARMPKKTKLYGWQCSACASSTSDGSESAQVSVSEPRRMREVRKAPVKFSPLLLVRERARRTVSQKRKTPGDALLGTTVPAENGDRTDDSENQIPTESRQKRPKVNLCDNSVLPPRAQTGAEESHTAKLDTHQHATPVTENQTQQTRTKPQAARIVHPPSRSDQTQGRSQRRKSPRKSSVQNYRKLTKDVDGDPAQSRKAQRPAADTKLRAWKCDACSERGSSVSMVRCDGCALCFHMQCLSPPLTETPKRPGYMWFCRFCDVSGSSEEDSDDDVVAISSDGSSVELDDSAGPRTLATNGRDPPEVIYVRPQQGHTEGQQSVRLVSPDLSPEEKASLSKVTHVVLEKVALPAPQGQKVTCAQAGDAAADQTARAEGDPCVHAVNGEVQPAPSSDSVIAPWSSDAAER